MANNSITAIQDAINKVSSQRSALGALQNRLEHTIANLEDVYKRQPQQFERDKPVL